MPSSQNRQNGHSQVRKWDECVRKKSGVPELNQAKLGLVKLRQGCWSNFNVVVKCLQSTNFFLKTLSVAEL